MYYRESVSEVTEMNIFTWYARHRNVASVNKEGNNVRSSRDFVTYNMLSHFMDAPRHRRQNKWRIFLYKENNVQSYFPLSCDCKNSLFTWGGMPNVKKVRHHMVIDLNLEPWYTRFTSSLTRIITGWKRNANYRHVDQIIPHQKSKFLSYFPDEHNPRMLKLLPQSD